jgi:hypothetical protein
MRIYLLIRWGWVVSRVVVQTGTEAVDAGGFVETDSTVPRGSRRASGAKAAPGSTPGSVVGIACGVWILR